MKFIENLKSFYSVRKNQAIYISLSIFAQLLNVLVVLYYVERTSVQDISLFTQLTSYSAIGLSVAFLRIDTLLVISNSLRNLIYRITSSILAFSIVFTFFLIFIIWGNFEYNWFDEFPLDYLFSFLAQSLIILFYAISNCLKNYKTIGYSILLGVLVLALFYFSFDKLTTKILFRGIWISQVIVLLVNSHIYQKIIKIIFKKGIIQFKNLRKRFEDIKKYLLISSPSTFLNSIIQQFPVLFLSTFSDPLFLYYYFLFSKLVLSPLSLIFNPVNQILLKEFSEINLSKVWKSIIYFLKRIIMFSPMIIILSIIGAYILDFILIVDDFQKLLFVLVVLTPVYFFQFFVSTISNIIPVTGELQYEVYWKLPTSLFLIGIINYLKIKPDFYLVFTLTSILILLSYLFYLLLIRNLLVRFTK